MTPITLFIALFLATLLVIFGAQNTQSVTFLFLMFDIGPAPVVFMVFIAALVGAVLAWAVSLPRLLRAGRERHDLEKELSASQRRTASALTDMEATRASARPHAHNTET